MYKPRAYELACACFFACQMDPAGSAALVSGYRSVTPLNPAELAEDAAVWACSPSITLVTRRLFHFAATGSAVPRAVAG